MKKQILSFGYAFRGIFTAICTEPHLRFHLVAAVYVLAFAAICGFSSERWAILLILISAVIALELINTAIESVCNLVTREFHPLIKLAKDLAAGAVLMVSFAAAVVGVLFFLCPDSLHKIMQFFAAHPVAFAPLLISAAVAVWFVLRGPKGLPERKK